MSAAKTHIVFQMKVPDQPARIIVFDTQDLSIGRSGENDLPIEHAEMSRKHAVIKRVDGVCVVQDLGTSNGTFVNDQSVGQAELSNGDVVRVAEVELVYRETTRNPAQLGARAEYASQLKGFGVPGAGGDGEATMLGLVDTLSDNGMSDDDDGFEIRPAGDFDFGLHEAESKAGAARNLDLELGDLGGGEDDGLGLESAPPPAKAVTAPGTPPATAVSTQVWDLEEEDGAAPTGRLSLHLEIEGLTPDLHVQLKKLAGKVIGLPQLRIRIKSEDLG